MAGGAQAPPQPRPKQPTKLICCQGWIIMNVHDNIASHIDKVRPKCSNPGCKGQSLLFYRHKRIWRCILCNKETSVTDEQMRFIGERKTVSI